MRGGTSILVRRGYGGDVCRSGGMSESDERNVV